MQTLARGAAALFVLSLSLAVASPASAQESKPFSIDDLVRLSRVSEAAQSPDGRYVLYTQRDTDFEANKGRTDLWQVEVGVADAKPMRLTQNEANDTSGRWSPDGKRIYFLSTRSGSSQVWRLDRSGGEAMQVTRLPVDVGAFEVSPRGDRLVVSLEVFADCADLDCTAKRVGETEKSKQSGMAFDRVFVRHWGSWMDGRQNTLYSLALDATGAVTGNPVSLTARLDADVPSRPFGGTEEFSFSPDGSKVAFAARLKGKSEPWSTNFDVYEVPVDGSAQPRNLTADNEAWDTQPAWSPDGQWLAWLAMSRPTYEADRFELKLRNVKSGETRRVTRDWDHSVGAFQFTRDGRRAIANADRLGQHALFAVDLKSGKLLWESTLGTTRDQAPFPMWLPLGSPNLGGSIATAGGVVFIGATTDQFVRGFDAQSGEEIWSARLPYTANATPVTYRLRRDGRQFLVVAAGGHGWSEPGDTLVAFALPER